MSENPTVSIIIPTYNRACLLPEAVNSALDQTFQDFELIIVDDGSTDGTEEQVKSFQDHRIRYFRHQTNIGASAARNTGIRKAKGEYLAFLDSDDLWMPQKLESQLEVFRTTDLPAVGAVFCGSVWEDGSGSAGKDLKALKWVRGWVFEDLLSMRMRYFGAPLLMVKNLRSDSIFFDVNLNTHEDYEFLLQYSRRWQIDYTPKVLVWARLAGTNHLNRVSNRMPALRHLLKKYQQDLSARPKIASSYHFRLGKLYASSGAIAAARLEIWQAIRIWPYSPVMYVWLLSTISKHLFTLAGFIHRTLRRIGQFLRIVAGSRFGLSFHQRA